MILETEADDEKSRGWVTATAARDDDGPAATARESADLKSIVCLRLKVRVVGGEEG